jgi:CHAT domain-containing protein
LNNLASNYAYLGDYQKAIELNQQALIIYKQILGENHPNYAASLSNLATDYFYTNNFVNSAQYLQQSSRSLINQLKHQFTWLTEKERNLFWEKQKHNYMFLSYFSFASGNQPAFEKMAYDGALLSKGLLLQSSQSLDNLLMESVNEETIEKAEELRIIHHTLNRLYEKPIAERYLNADSLETVAQNLERELLAQSKEYGDYTRFMSITWQDVQKNLGEKDVAIEFVEFPVLKSDSIMYAALVLRKDWEHPQMISLFEKKQIEQYLQQSPEKQYAGFVGKQLYQLMWKPLKEVIQQGENVYFSAAGVYHQLALEYLPSDDGTPLCDLYNFRRLSSTRQLALDENNVAIKSATLYGGIQYDVNPTQMLTESKKYQKEESLYAYRGTSVDSLRGNKWVTLDNTVPEIEFISDELNRNKVQATVFTSTNANEESLKDLSGKKINILHLATHGFFLPIEETRKIDYFQMLGRDNNPTPDMSMRRSGLVMAGGNGAWSGDSIPEGIDDGILTAQEISVLDFREMDLVVLSACETGLGDINTSEGVFGLQRAFKKAGAKTLIMSLWKVNDEITKTLMNKFYQSLFTGKSKNEAFLEAQQFIRSRHPEPQNWAAFIMLD